MSFWNTWLGSGISKAVGPGAGGFVPMQIDPNAPGASVDQTQSDQDQQQQQQLQQLLMQQAQNGNPAALQQLQQSLGGANQTAQALGQSAAQQQGLGNMAAMRGIQNTQAHNAALEAGQANILKNQSQLSAQDQLQQLLGTQGSQDLLQAQNAQQAQQGTREANLSLIQNSQQNLQNAIGAASMGMAKGSTMGGSHGGKVPGKPRVFGDDEANDTVKAKLSPGEIVIPRSITTQPDAPEKARAFVAALKAKHQGGGRHFADGGSTGIQTSDPGQIMGNVDWGSPGTWLNPLGAVSQAEGMAAQAPSVQNGGLLDMSQYNANRGNMLALNQQLAARAAGRGPSTVNQQFQNATDANIANAMGAQAGMRPGGGNQADLSGLLAQAGNNQAGLVGRAGEAKLGEVTSGQEHQAQLLNQLRGQDIGAAASQQQAAFQNTLMNAGIGLQQQAALRGMMTAGGQAMAAAAANRNPGTGDPYDPNSFSNDPNAYSQAAPTPDMSDANNPDSGGDSGQDNPDVSGDQGEAHGGEILPKENDKHIYVKKGGATLKIAKKGIGEEMLAKLRGGQSLAGGGVARAKPREQVETVTRPQQGTGAPPRAAVDIKPTEAEESQEQHDANQARIDQTAREANQAKGGEIGGYSDEDNDAASQVVLPENIRGGLSAVDDVLNTPTPAAEYVTDPNAPGPEATPADKAKSVLGKVSSDAAQANQGLGEGVIQGAKGLGKMALTSLVVPPVMGPATGPMIALQNQMSDPATQAAIEKTKQKIGDAAQAVGNFVAPNLVSKEPDKAFAAMQPPADTRDKDKKDAGKGGGLGMGSTEKPGLAGQGAMDDYDAATKQIREAYLGTDKEPGLFDLQKYKLANDFELQQQGLQQDATLAAQQQKMQTDYHADLQRRTQEANDALDKWSNASIDPNHFWASRTTADKVLASVGIVLGGLNGGPNQALQVIDRAIDRDFEAQKGNIEKMGRVAEGKQHILGQMRANFDSEYGAMNMARAAAYQRVENQIKANGSLYGQLMAKPEGQAFLAGLNQKGAEFKFNALQEADYKAKMVALEQQKVELERARVAQGKQALALRGNEQLWNDQAAKDTIEKGVEAYGSGVPGTSDLEREFALRSMHATILGGGWGARVSPQAIEESRKNMEGIVSRLKATGSGDYRKRLSKLLFEQYLRSKATSPRTTKQEVFGDLPAET